MKVLSLATEMGSKIFSHLHQFRIFMYLANHLLQFFHIWLFVSHNNLYGNQPYKIFARGGG